MTCPLSFILINSCQHFCAHFATGHDIAMQRNKAQSGSDKCLDSDPDEDEDEDVDEEEHEDVQEDVYADERQRREC